MLPAPEKRVTTQTAAAAAAALSLSPFLSATDLQRISHQHTQKKKSEERGAAEKANSDGVVAN